MISVSAIQLKILMGLAQFRFLTSSQMLRLNIGTASRKTLWKHTDILRSRSRGFIDRIEYQTIVRLGRVEDVYYLTAKGRSLLINLCSIDEGAIYVPNGSPQLTDDYRHRIDTINFHIELSKFIFEDESKLNFFDPYFIKRKVGSKFYSITSIKLDDENMIPDAVFMITRQERSRLFLFELHNGRSIRRLKDQILNHAIALTQRKTHTAFDIPVEQFYYVLIVLENEAAFESLISEIKDLTSQYKNIHQFFLCKSLAQVEELTFWKNWTSILGEEIEIEI